MRSLIVLLFVGVLAAQQPPPPDTPPVHDPQSCARVETFRDDGTRVHACTCKRMGHMNGEDCDSDQEDRACKAYCRKDLCSCPIECAAPVEDKC